jgi:hypothetical protein
MQTGGLARFGRVFFHGWKTSLAAIALCMALSLLLVGFSMPYWKIADQDLPLAYNALALNDGRPQEYFEHTGYLFHLLLAAWYRLLHWFGLLPVHALSELPPATDVPAFDQAWQRVVEAGRVFSLILGIAFVWVYAALMRRLVGDWRIAVMAAVALAWSGGLAMHIRIMRTELLSAGLITCALMLVLVAARSSTVRRAIYVGLAGLCASLAIITKVQALLPALAIPILALAFGQTVPAEEREARGAARPWTVAAVAIALAVALAWPALSLLVQGMASATNHRPIGGGLSGIYQWLIALWIAGAMLAYAVAYRVSVTDTVAAMTALAAGIALGLLSLDIRYHVENVIAVANPVEHMFPLAANSTRALLDQPQVLTGAFAWALAKGVAQSLALHSFVFSTSARPTVLLEWFAIIGAIVLWRRGERRLPLQVALLIATVWGLDAVFSLRSLQTPYFVYTDPLLILAAALVLAHLPELQSRRWAQHAAIALLLVTVVWAHLEPVKAILRHDARQEACLWLPAYVTLVRFPFCRS